MNHKTDIEAPTEIYVWFADNKGTERDGERFIRAWTMDPVRADGLRGAIGRAPAVYRTIEASQSAGVTDEPKRGTDAQILFELKLTCEAINGAIAFGYQNTNPPPSDDHWLAPFWKIGRKQAEMESAQNRSGSRCSLGVGCDETGICYAMANGQPEKCAAAPTPVSETTGEMTVTEALMRDLLTRGIAIHRIAPADVLAEPASVSEAEQPSAPDYTDCCDTPSLCSSVRRCTAQDAPRARGAACPHGVDDGACKQCYGEATSGEQGAALSDDARECLMDVVSHHDNIVAGFAAQRLNACEAGDSDNATYWTREMNVAHRMKTQAERALAASAPTLSEIDWREKFFAEQRARMELEAALHLVVEDKPQPQAAEPKGLTEEQIEKAALDFVKKPGMQGYVEPGDLIDFARALLANGE